VWRCRKHYCSMQNSGKAAREVATPMRSTSIDPLRVRLLSLIAGDGRARFPGYVSIAACWRCRSSRCALDGW
jgi:hypothetical protein